MRIIGIVFSLLISAFPADGQLKTYYAWLYWGEGDYLAFQLPVDWSHLRGPDSIKMLVQSLDAQEPNLDKVSRWKEAFQIANMRKGDFHLGKLIDGTIRLWSVKHDSVRFSTNRFPFNDGNGWMECTYRGRHIMGSIRGILYFRFSPDSLENKVYKETRRIRFSQER